MLEQTPTAVNQTSEFVNDLWDSGLTAIGYFKQQLYSKICLG